MVNFINVLKKKNATNYKKNGRIQQKYNLNLTHTNDTSAHQFTNIGSNCRVL